MDPPKPLDEIAFGHFWFTSFATRTQLTSAAIISVCSSVAGLHFVKTMMRCASPTSVKVGESAMV